MVERLRAVVAGADGDAFLIEEGGEVRGVHALDVEGAESCAVRMRGGGVCGHVNWRSVDSDAGDRGEASVQVRGELVLVGLDLGHADRAQVVTCRP